MSKLNKIRVAFDTAICAIAICALAIAITWKYPGAKFLPIVLSILVFIFGANDLRIQLRKRTAAQPADEPVSELDEEDAVAARYARTESYAEWKRFAIAMAWIVGLVVSYYLLGILLASFIFCVSFLKWRGRSWVKSGLFAIVLLGFCYLFFVIVLKVEMLPGLLFNRR